ncbi:MAG: NADH-ubiquinone oxidoreductase chain K, partial [uncultured Sphingomonas sp.]
DRPRPLPDGRRHPVRDRGARHLSQPAQRHFDADVHRVAAIEREHQPGRVQRLPRRHGGAGVRHVRADGGRGGSSHRARHHGHLLPPARQHRHRRRGPDARL